MPRARRWGAEPGADMIRNATAPRDCRGFTLIELMIVVVIIGIL
ncbi:MAG: type IV pilin protein, partial [Candidatus Eiseniibacteriota bacterium]